MKFAGHPIGNTLTNTILGYLEANRLQEAVKILFQSPDSIPYSLYSHLFGLCSDSHAIVEARKVESHLVSSDPVPPTFLLNRAIETYGVCGCLEDARSLFDEMPVRDGGSWNALIKAYVQCGRPRGALELFVEMNGRGVCGNDVTLANVLGACGSLLEGVLAMQVHGNVVKRGFSRNVILCSSIVDVYGKCDGVADARRMFDEMECPNEVTWNVIIRRYIEAGDENEAVVMFAKMIDACVKPLKFAFSNALVGCSGMCALHEGRQIHGVVSKFGFEEDMEVSSALLDMYAKCSELDSACKIFDRLGSRDVVSCTSMVSAYAKAGRIREARNFFNVMPEWNVVSWNAMLAGYTHSRCWVAALDFVRLMLSTTEDIDHVTLGLMLNVSAGVSDLVMGKQIHGFTYRHGFDSNVLIANALLDMYGKCGNLKHVRSLFTQMSQRDTISWNALLASCTRYSMSEQAITAFRAMITEAKPDNSTFGTILAACANISALNFGKQIHAFIIRNGHELNMMVRGALVDMYCKCRSIAYALAVFRSAGPEDAVLWNSILLGCCHNHRVEEALQLFALMERKGVKPDHVTFQAILLACKKGGFLELGRQYFDSMSTKYCVMPRFEHYQYMVELFLQQGSLLEVEKFVKEMPFEPTLPLLSRISQACEEERCYGLGEWVAGRLKQLKC